MKSEELEILRRLRSAKLRIPLLIFSFSFFTLHSESAEPFARSRLEPGARVIVGQPVTVTVEVLVPTWFTAAPWFPNLDVDDAIAIYEDRGVNFTERIDGETWSGQSRSYHVYPQRPGAYEIAAIPVRVRYTSESTGPRTRATVSPPAVRFAASVPPAARGLAYFISTTGLEIEQSFDRRPETLKVGEAFTRTVTISVADALSMVIPPRPSDLMPGLAIYPDPPEVRDEGGERGQQVVGRRIERTTYVAEREGRYRLEAIELAWWDIDTEEMTTTTLPAVEFEVESSPDQAAEIPLPPDEAAGDLEEAEDKARVSLLDLLRRWFFPVSSALLVLLGLTRLWQRWEPALRRRLEHARRRRQDSEDATFARFRRAVRSGDPLATWNLWTSWLDRIHRGPGAATIRAFVDAAGDSELERQTDALDARLFAAGGDRRSEWSPRALERKVAAARRRGRSRSRKEEALRTSLNPP